METLNTAFFFVTDLIISTQGFFIAQAWHIGSFVLVISLSTAAINYAVTGQGLKENIIKIAKAVVFFVVIIGVYPRIIGGITEQAFVWAHASVYVHIAPHLQAAREEAVEAALAAPPAARSTFIGRLLRSEGFNPDDDPDPMRFFSTMIQRRETGEITYTVVAPAAAMGVVMLVAGQALDFARTGGATNFFAIFVGAIVAFAVMFVGSFAVIEYLMAFLEFMLVAGVGVILFPLSLWEGSKFLAEKLIGAIIGFFIKLLFCNITMFLMLFGYTALLRGFVNQPFSGQPDEILIILFVSLLFFYLCRSAPALAQSLLTGTPSLSAAGAIGTAAAALKAGVATAKMAGSGGKALAQGGAKAAFAGGGMAAQAAGAARGAMMLGGGIKGAALAAAGSVAASGKQALLAGGGNLARSLLSSGGGSGGGGGSAGDGGLNRHDQLQQHLSRRDADGNREKTGEYMGSRYKAGLDRGQEYMLEREKERNDPGYWDQQLKSRNA